MQQEDELLKNANQEEEKPQDGDGVTPTPSEEVVEDQSQQLEGEEDNQDDNLQPQPSQPRMFSQEELNDIVGKTRQEARDKALKSFYDRYGVQNDDELNDIFGRGQAYSVLNDNFNEQGNLLKQISAENALLKSKILEDRWDDVKLILGGKGLEVNPENIASELATHPEWVATQQPQGQDNVSKPFTEEMAKNIVNTPNNQPKDDPSLIRKFGTDVPKNDEEMSDDTIISKLFGV